MREIEFKGKNLESGEWAYGDLLQNSDGIRFAIVPKNNGYNVFDEHLVDEDTIGQCIKYEGNEHLLMTSDSE